MTGGNRRVVVNGVGCSCADYLFTGFDFNAELFQKYVSKKPGDGGISIGHLIFRTDLEAFAGKSIDEIRRDQGWMRVNDHFSVGGPCIVGLINAAQLLKGGLIENPDQCEFNFYGAMGQDVTGDRMLKVLNQCPVNLDHYLRMPSHPSAATLVLSDQNFKNGSGERSFVYHGGALDAYTPEMLGDDFFKADVTFFSGTASVPLIHQHITTLLRRAKASGSVTMVGTVFDFLNEKRNPHKRWPLGESDESYRLIDILAVDFVEAQRMSGEVDMQKAIQFFLEKGVHSLFVTNGDEPGYVWSDGTLFVKQALTQFNICQKVVQHLKANPHLRGDTTGCGDNFAGGLLASVVKQLVEGRKPGELSLADALAWANGSGSFCCYAVGGTYLEAQPGEKLRGVKRIHDVYVEQLAAEGTAHAAKM
ncbi:PfkB domain-containing protein [Leptomonas seymouri]|uniref:PfkB domain-containing protein n=1 Tax=Leptomonas seymouri TaxID=5684 RepID=A0A0N1I3K1_LEPSE|nr:PfkB domain-containing protein [Leptomonas seymouri]|eukprot:KPI86521.1 PfkB domain-containing protein [Leptomonas seymouri]